MFLSQNWVSFGWSFPNPVFPKALFSVHDFTQYNAFHKSTYNNFSRMFKEPSVNELQLSARNINHLR